MQHARKRADRDSTGTASPARRTEADIGLYHVAGILVYAALAREDEVRSAIAALPGALVHAHVDGKIVATLEGAVSSAIADALNTVQRMPGVLSAVLVSEHSEPIDGIDQEISNDR